MEIHWASQDAQMPSVLEPSDVDRGWGGGGVKRHAGPALKTGLGWGKRTRKLVSPWF